MGTASRRRAVRPAARCSSDGQAVGQGGVAAAMGDYDRATEFEALGGKLIELPSGDWQELAEAA